MGKTLKGIITIGIGSVLAIFNPALGAALIGIGIQTLLTKIPKPPSTEQAIKQPKPSRVTGYGVGRYHMIYALFETNDDGKTVDVGAFMDGRANAVRQVYVGDKRVTVLPGGWVKGLPDGTFGKDNDVIQVGWRLGLPTETAFSEVISALPDHWSADHRGDGVVTGFMIARPVKAKNFSKIYPSGGPNATPLSLALEAQLVFDWRDSSQSLADPSTWKWSENWVLHTAHYLLVRMNKDWDRNIAPTLSYWTAAANDADVPVPLKGMQALLTAEAAPDGDHTIILSNVNGLHPGMQVTITVPGDNSKTETRTVASISGLTVTLTSEISHKHPQGSGVTWVSDPSNPATEPRYRSWVSHQLTDEHKDVLAHLLSCGDGWLVERSDGAYVIYSGRYYEPTVTIGPDEIVSYSLQEGVPEEDAVNTLKVTYISENHDYNVVDTDDWTDETDIEVRGKTLSDQLDNQVPSHSQGRRLAKRALARINAPKRGTTTTTAAGRVVLTHRFIRQILREAGTTFLDAPVEITKITRNMQTGGVTYEWVLADPNIDEWNPATEEGDPAPIGNRVASQPLDAPVITSATPNFGTDSATGATGVYLDLTIEGPDRSDLTWYARTRVVGAVTWGEREYSDIAPDSTVEIATEFVPADASVEVQVAYAIGDGRVSPYSDSAVVDTSSAHVPPARVTGLTASGDVGQATVQWNNPTSSNLAAERLYASTTPSFGSATQLGSDYTDAAGTASSHTVSLAAGDWYFWVTTVSTGGAESTPVGPVSATVT